jgi:hypothetical protein
MIREGPSYASASRNAVSVCWGSAPIATRATYTLASAITCSARSLLAVVFPAAENFATAPSGVAFDVCPPVFE